MVKVFFFDVSKVKEALEEFVLKLKGLPEVLKVIIFGSFVRNECVPGSDIDLLIILKDSKKRFIDRICDYKPSNFPVGVDVFPYTTSEINKMLKEGNMFIRRILTEGKEL